MAKPYATYWPLWQLIAGPAARVLSASRRPMFWVYGFPILMMRRRWASRSATTRSSRSRSTWSRTGGRGGGRTSTRSKSKLAADERFKVDGRRPRTTGSKRLRAGQDGPGDRVPRPTAAGYRVLGRAAPRREPAGPRTRSTTLLQRGEPAAGRGRGQAPADEPGCAVHRLPGARAARHEPDGRRPVGRRLRHRRHAGPQAAQAVPGHADAAAAISCWPSCSAGCCSRCPRC